MLAEMQTLGRAIKVAQYRHHRAANAALTSAGTTLAQWDALRAIDMAPGSSAHDLAVATFQSDQAFGTLATRLITQGLIERENVHGRRIEHRLTQAGAQVLADGSEVVDGVLAMSFRNLTASERATLTELLGKVDP